jgi:hypothetical protein
MIRAKNLKRLWIEDIPDMDLRVLGAFSSCNEKFQRMYCKTCDFVLMTFIEFLLVRERIVDYTDSTREIHEMSLAILMYLKK